MRFDKNALNEARRNPDQSRPTWMTDDLWNELSNERKKEVVEKEARVQQEMETVRNQAEQKAKYTPGNAPTSDNLKDYFDFVDRIGAQARASGEDIGIAANRETAKAIEAQRATKKQIEQEKRDESVKERLSKSENLGQRMQSALGGTETSDGVPDLLRSPEVSKTQTNVPDTGFTARAKMEQQLQSQGIDPATATAEEIKAAAGEIQKNQAREVAAKLKSTEQIFSRLTSRGRGGEITTEKGETINLGGIEKPDFNDPELQRKVKEVSGYYAGLDAAAAKTKAEEEKQTKMATRFSNMATTAMQSAIAKDPSLASKYQAQAAQQQAFQSYTSGMGAQATTPAPSIAPAETPQTTTSGNIPVGGKPQPAPVTTQVVPSTNQQTGQFGVPFDQASAVKSVADQKKLLASLLQPQKPTRLSAKKATATVGSKGQISVVAEEVKVRFKKYDLQDLLEAAGKKVSPKDLVNIGKKVKEVVKKAPAFAKAASRFDPTAVNKILDAIKIANPYGFKAPQDRVVYTPAQTGYSHKKAVRTVKQLMKNPVVNAIPGPETLLNYGGAALQLGGRALIKGMPKIAGLGKFGQEIGRRMQDLGISLDTPEAKAAKAIAIGAIIGDPRTAQVQVGEVMDDETDSTIKLPRKSKSSPGSSSGTP